MIARYLLIFLFMFCHISPGTEILDIEPTDVIDFKKTSVFEDSWVDQMFEYQDEMNMPSSHKAFTVRISHQLFGQVNNHSIELPSGQRYQKTNKIEHNRTGINIRYASSFASNWLLQGSWQARLFWNEDYEYEANKSIAAEYRVNELFLQRSLGRHSLKLGRQTVVWGRTVGNSVLDVINHTEFRDFSIIDIEDARLNQWMLIWDVFDKQSQFSSFLNLYPEFNPSPEEGSPLYFALPIKLDDTRRNSSPIFEAGARWSKSYDRSDIALMGAYLWENQLQYKLSANELMQSPGIKNDFYLLGLSANYASDRLLLTLDVALSRGVFLEKSLLSITSPENIADIKKDQLGISFGFEYGISSTQDLSLSAKMETVVDERDGLRANQKLVTEGTRGTWLLRYSKRILDENITFSSTLQGDLDGNFILISLRSDFAISDQIEIGYHLLFIDANSDSQMTIFDQDLRLGATLTYFF